MTDDFMGRMCALMQSADRYRLDDESLVGKELDVYSTALRSVFHRFERLMQECFVSTASGEGLRLREELYAVGGEAFPVEERRKKLIERMAKRSGVPDVSWVKKEIRELWPEKNIKIFADGNGVHVRGLHFVAVNKPSIEKFAQIASLIVRSQTPMSPTVLSGSGLMFLEWENMMYNWNFIDKNTIAFDLIDSALSPELSEV